jgi:hypothetical protein
MKNSISIGIVSAVTLLLTVYVSRVYAQNPTEGINHKSVSSSENSAHFEVNVYQNRTGENDDRKMKLVRYLQRSNSPLLGYIDDIITSADLYDVDWTLVTAISGVESGFCRQIPYNSYNCWGWKNGEHAFENYKSAIYEVTRVLRLNYMNKGLTTPELISPIYAPPSTTWASKVRYFMNRIDTNQEDKLMLQINI